MGRAVLKESEVDAPICHLKPPDSLFRLDSGERLMPKCSRSVSKSNLYRLRSP